MEQTWRGEACLISFKKVAELTRGVFSFPSGSNSKKKERKLLDGHTDREEGKVESWERR